MNDFWSRRKAAVEAEKLEDARIENERAADAREQELAERSDAEILEELGLPDPDDLSEGDDFSVFLSKAVPNRIRTRALRKLWLTNPVLANVDGLVDYGEDFTDAACVVENLQTAYQVGKGMTQHVLEMLKDETPAPTPEDDPVDIDVAEEEPNAPIAVPQPEPHPIAALEPEPEDTPLPRRRMRFDFEEPEATV